MKNLVKFSMLVFILGSCKSSYTGFNAYKGSSHNYKPKVEQPSITQLLKTEQIENQLTASVSNFSESNIMIEKLKTVESLHNNELKTVNKTIDKSTKLTFKDRFVTKIVQKQIKKANLSATQPDGFSSLDGKLKIGLILLAVAVGLSIIGLGSLAGLAGLIGLIFVVIGLLNMYN